MDNGQNVCIVGTINKNAIILFIFIIVINEGTENSIIIKLKGREFNCGI